MVIGGVQKSLHNLLWAVHDQYDVTLCLFHASGVYMDQLPQNVRVIESKGLCRYLGVSQGQCKGVHKLIRGTLAGIAKVFGRSVAMKLVLAGERKMLGSYDCAISFLHNGNIHNFYGGVQEFVLNKIESDRKVAFLHCDYRNSGANHPVNNRLIARFDRIVACSDGCRSAFEAVLPELASKCVTVRNFHRFSEIRRMAEQGSVCFEGQLPNVVMVSRLSHEKGVERAVVAAANAKKQGFPMMLHIVGSGPMEPMLKETVKALQMEKNVIFHGQQSNPYGYMAAADLFLMSSFHEAAPMVIEEAVSLGIPVLTTDTTSSKEMVEQTGAGWVCDNCEESLSEMLCRILSDPEKLINKKKQLQQLRMDNTTAQEQLLHLFEESYENDRPHSPTGQDN